MTTKRKTSKEYTLLWKHRSDLVDAMLNPVVIASQLYGEKLISIHTHEKVKQVVDREGAVAGATTLVDAICSFLKVHPLGKQLRSKFFKILELFKDDTPLDIIAKSMENEYNGVLLENSDSEDPDSSGDKNPDRSSVLEDDSTRSDARPPQKQITAFDQLSEALRMYTHDINASMINPKLALEVIKSRVENHISKSLEDGVTVNVIRRELDELIMNASIPIDIKDWCYEKLEELQKTLLTDSTDEKNSETSETDKPAPLFCKEIVHHSSVCCDVLAAVNAKPSTSLLKGLQSYRHSFDEVSLSNNQDMLIAEQKDIVYITFYVPESQISEREMMIRPMYVKNGNFSSTLPIRYFTELLDHGKRLVFTGFSNGGLIARDTIASLWHAPFFSSDVLYHNVCCIMFGPLVSRYYDVQRVLRFPQLLKTVHSFLLKDDFIPKFSCLDGFPVMMDFDVFKNFKTFKSRLQELLYSFQLSSGNIHSCFGNAYIIQQDDFTSYWDKAEHPDDQITSITRDQLRKLEPHNLKLHQMSCYHVAILRGYLEKEPVYKMPDQKIDYVNKVKSVLPVISKLEVHCQRLPDNNKELTFTFKGDNLWFCTCISLTLSEKKSLNIKIGPEEVSGKQIQYCHGVDASFGIFKGSFAEVAVQCKFVEIKSHRIPMTFSEPEAISFRQGQLARQNPSEIIQLSFLSALLELSPSVQGSATTSQRFLLITKFLQEAARIVPLESILFTIASCSSVETVGKCIDLLVSSHSILPQSKLMKVGYEKALNRLQMHSPHVLVHADVPRVAYTRTKHSPHYHLMPVKRSSSANYHDGLNVKEGNTSQFQYETPSFLLPAPYISAQYYGHNRLYHGIPYSSSEKNMMEFLDFFKHIRYMKTNQLICGRNIGEVYPVTRQFESCKGLQTLPEILRHARELLLQQSISHLSKERDVGAVASENSQMLKIVNTLIQEELEPCVTMLGEFMEQQIRIPLVNNPKATAEAFIAADNSSVGVWALFALDGADILNILSSRRKQAFVVQITDFIHGVLNTNMQIPHDVHRGFSSYDGKLQFLLQSMTKTVTCSNHYISYTLERELVKLCKQFNITPESSVSDVILQWDEGFKETALALVPNSHRSLVARWMIWALNIYQLREGLANYITVGVIGLVNSGKSTLVKKIFKKETVAGTTQSARTTVPFIYNMDESIEGLSIIDFPGVDDRDPSIKDLAKLLVGLAQVIIFVCGYERFHTESAKEWADAFNNQLASTPVLICLTQADNLYEDCEEEIVPKCPESEVPKMKQKFQTELKQITTKYCFQQCNNCTVKFCSLTQRKHSPMNCCDGRQSMRAVGIFTPQDISQWLTSVVKKELQHPDLAERLKKFTQHLE